MKKTKRIIAVIIGLIIIMALFGCGKDDTASTEAENESVAVDTYETENEEEEPADSNDEEADDESEDEDSEDEDSGVISPEFKKTMDDYEAWFDHYCEVLKKYEENPSDLEILSEYTELMSEEVEMFDQMEKMDESEMSNAELAYYLEVTARIEKKLLETAS